MRCRRAVEQEVGSINACDGFAESDGNLRQMPEARARRRINGGYRGRDIINQRVGPRGIGAKVIESVAKEVRDVVAAIPTGFNDTGIGGTESKRIHSTRADDISAGAAIENKIPGLNSTNRLYERDGYLR